MDQVFTFEKFIPDAVIGRVTSMIDGATVDLWRRIYPQCSNESMWFGLSTVLLMRAWQQVVAPRPPGNIHATQKIEMYDAPRLLEAVTTEVRCAATEIRKGRRNVQLATCSVGADGRRLFDGRFGLIWAA